ncbi:MAG: hypothetical protein D6770_07635 [Anaerolineae bacterium]|nr:MAG: hypothetical protein D6770_07635 [Anaerolineae bacterium]
MDARPSTLCRWVSGPIILIWDRSSVHRSRVAKEFLAQYPHIQTEWLPPYALELNPEEHCGGNIKRRMRNGVYHSKAKTRKQDPEFARLRKRPDLVPGFFQHTASNLTTYGEDQ